MHRRPHTDASARSNRRGITATVAAPVTSDTPTSSGVCTPRYMRENATARIPSTHRTVKTRSRTHRASMPSTHAADCVCPLGKE